MLKSAKLALLASVLAAWSALPALAAHAGAGELIPALSTSEEAQLAAVHRDLDRVDRQIGGEPGEPEARATCRPPPAS